MVTTRRRQRPMLLLLSLSAISTSLLLMVVASGVLFISMSDVLSVVDAATTTAASVTVSASSTSSTSSLLRRSRPTSPHQQQHQQQHQHHRRRSHQNRKNGRMKFGISSSSSSSISSTSTTASFDLLLHQIPRGGGMVTPEIKCMLLGCQITACLYLIYRAIGEKYREDKRHNNNSRCGSSSSSSEDVLIPELKKFWRVLEVFLCFFVPKIDLFIALVGYSIKEYGKYTRNGRDDCDDLLIHDLKGDTSPLTRYLHRLEKIVVQREEEEEFVLSKQRTKALLLKRRREKTVNQFRGGGSGSDGDGSAEENNKGSRVVGKRNRNGSGSSRKSNTSKTTTTSNPFLVAMAAAAITTTTTTTNNNNEHGPVILEDPGSQTIHEILQKLKYNKPPTTTISKSNNNNNDDEEYLDLDLDNNDIYEKYDSYEEYYLENGLSNDMASELLQVYGRNEIQEIPPPSYFTLIKEQFEDRLVRILVGVALLSAVLEYTSSTSSGSGGSTIDSLWHRFAEPVVISSLLMVNAAVGVWQSKSASGSIAALKAMQPNTCTVIREGGQEVAEYPSSQLVPGDVMVVTTGDKIPADGRLVSYYKGRRTLKVDEACLTGESVAVEKLTGTEGLAATHMPVPLQYGCVYGGTTVVNGGGIALVTSTGAQTEFGKIQQGVVAAKQDSHDHQKTPLAKQLDDFGQQLTSLIGIICGLVWLASIPKMRSSTVFQSPWEGMVYYAKVAVALGVAAIPEGLPAVITLCLSLGTRRMAQRNVIVRHLPSVETLGCVSVICSDKTGTLTTNEMTVTSLVLFDKNTPQQPQKKQREKKKHQIANPIVEYTIAGVSYSPIGKIQGLYETDYEYDDDYARFTTDQRRGSALTDIMKVAALCNDARILGHDEITNEHQRAYERVGEPTEAALCVLAEKIGRRLHYYNDQDDTDDAAAAEEEGDAEVGDVEAVTTSTSTSLRQQQLPSVLASAVVDAIRTANPRYATLEFHRERKSMSVLVDNSFSQQQGKGTKQELNNNKKKKKKKNQKTHNDLLVKGAANMVVNRCTHVKYRDGSVARLTASLKQDIEAKITDMATRPLRCLALAIKEESKLPSSLKHYQPTNNNNNNNEKDSNSNDNNSIRNHPLLSDPNTYEDIESGLTLVGLVGIKDPARPEVADSIRKCTDAGIRVMMITGDARDTAVAIAKDVNIFDKNADPATYKAFEGQEFFLKSKEEQLEILRTDNIVFCRAQPSDKQALIKMLQHDLQEIPAMTGDGVNDAPALQQAAIGVAMGTGTAVSKEAADMVLADDDFSTIVSAVEEGRTIYANMQAFICFLISCNIGEICAIFFATLLGFPEPLTAMHLLWVNLVTDGPPATALGFNPPSPNSMKDPPRPSNEPIMTRWLLIRYMLTGLYVGIATIGVFAQHYVQQGITLKQLSNWSNCGTSWIPPAAAVTELLAAGTSPASNSAAAASAASVSSTCSLLFRDGGRILPQTLSLTTLVCMEMLKALSAVSVNDSLFKVAPWRNKWLLLGVLGPFTLHLLVLYSSKLGLPGFGKAFGMVPLTVNEWKTVLLWASPILLVDEILKFTGRRLLGQEKSKSVKKKN